MTSAPRRTRRSVLGAAGLALLAGCSTGGSTDGGGTTGEVPSTTSPTGGDGDAPTGSGTASTSRDALNAWPPTRPPLSLPIPRSALREQAVSGGQPKDGIPSIDRPSFVDPGDADGWLAPGDPVFGVAVGSTVKAYPQSILVYHEIVNDEVDDTPVSVTYCPLTGTVLGFERGHTTFGVSGRLVNNNLIMYDRATETWWPQVLATSIPGPWNIDPPSRSLREFPVTWTTWGRWHDAHPETRVLSRDTGYARNYGGDPYGSYNPREGYYRPGTGPLFPSMSGDDRLPPKAVVIGARTAEGAVAVRKSHLREAGVVTGRLAGTPVVAVHDPVLDTGYVYLNPEGATFAADDGVVVGPAGETHDPDSLPLEELRSFDAMWFAWVGFYRETSLYA